jgi:acyl carrier protein
MTDSIQNDLITYLEDAIPPGVAVSKIELDTDLIGTGVIDSFGIVGVIEFMEERYGITVADEDIDPEIFRNVRSIEAYVQTEQGGAP